MFGLFFVVALGLRPRTELRSSLEATQDAVRRLREMHEVLRESEDPQVRQDLEALELAHPLAAMQAAIADKHCDSAYEQWRLEKLVEPKEKIMAAALVLDDDSMDDDWKKYAGAVAELGYWTLRGQQSAETVLLKTLKQSPKLWIQKEADTALRKVRYSTLFY